MSQFGHKYGMRKRVSNYAAETNTGFCLGFCCCVLFCLFRASSADMEVHRLGVKMNCSHWSIPQPQQHQVQATSATYTTSHGNARSLTH